MGKVNLFLKFVDVHKLYLMHQNQMSKSNILFKKRGNIRENDILCWDHFKQVLVRHFINLGKKSATHNNHWRQFTIHLNEDWTEAPFFF